jgi:hypothetical protein
MALTFSHPVENSDIGGNADSRTPKPVLDCGNDGALLGRGEVLTSGSPVEKIGKISDLSQADRASRSGAALSAETAQKQRGADHNGRLGQSTRVRRPGADMVGHRHYRCGDPGDCRPSVPSAQVEAPSAAQLGTAAVYLDTAMRSAPLHLGHLASQRGGLARCEPGSLEGSSAGRGRQEQQEVRIRALPPPAAVPLSPRLSIS